MQTSTDVSLPTDLVPVFPERCVCCEQSTEERSRISVQASNLISSLFVPLLVFFGWKRIEFPLCEHCKPGFYIQRWSRGLISILIVCVVFYIAMPFFKGWNRQLTRLVMLAIGVSALIPYFLFDVIFPRWLDVTAYRKKTEYEFRSTEYAIEFYAVNKAMYPDVLIEFEGESLDETDEDLD